MQKDSFERFYYEKVGLGEGCGCAEHVTRIRDLDALAEQMASGRARRRAVRRRGLAAASRRSDRLIAGALVSEA